MINALNRGAGKLLVLLLLSALAFGCSATQKAAKKPTPAKKENKNGIKAFSEVIKSEAKTDEGLFNVYKQEDEYYYEIPDSLLDREMLLISRIAKTATGIGYGGEKLNTQTVRWQRKEDKILLRNVSHINVANDSLPVHLAVENSNFEPIIASFPVKALGKDSSSVVIEVTGLYTDDVPSLGLQSRRRKQYKVRRLDGSRTFIEHIHSYPKNVEVRGILTYEASEPPANASTGTISLEVNHSMVLLPAKPMQPRIADDRVGFFTIEQTDYGLPAQRAKERRYITRWRLEPKDPEAYKRGELVEPVKPIVYYIDPAMPKKWRPFIKKGIEDWQEAFEEAGFKNAIIAKDPPTKEEDPEFSPEDVRYSVVRYFSSNVQNAYGPHVSDPRSGEILESDIGWYHNVMNLLRNWYFVQTAAINPKARHVELDTDVMGRLIRFVSSHEVGHTLGLPHNMKASSSYPVDSLRSPSFTKRMGTAPSIMDYARFNYVAQPGDGDVSLMPKIGPYDKYAVNWGYRWIPSAKSAEDEKDTLDQWILDHYDNPIYHFGNPSRIDPSSQTEDLGANSMKASQYGVANLKRIVPKLIEWTKRDGANYDQLRELYGQVLSQWNRYTGHVVTNIGGVNELRKTYDQDGPVYTTVPKVRQKEAMIYLNEYVFQTPKWLIERDILDRIESAGEIERIRRYQVRAVNQVLDMGRLARLIEQETMLGEDAYSPVEMLDDLREGVWSEIYNGKAIDTYRRNLQRGYLERMAELMKDEQPDVPDFIRNYYGFTEVNVGQSDIRPLVRNQLKTLAREIRRAERNTRDRTTRIHLADAMERIDHILNPDK